MFSQNTTESIPTTILPLLTTLEKNPTLVKLVGLIDGLLEFLVSTQENITILAPSEMAFRQLPKEVVAFLTDPKNINTLDKVLRYHILVPNTNTLINERYPKVIPIDKVLIPPSLSPDIAAIPVSTTTQTKQLNVPKWLVRPRRNNNWS